MSALVDGALLSVIVSELLETIAYSSVAAIGLTVIFSVAIVGVTKSADYARDDRRAASVGAGAVAVLAVGFCLASVGAGILVMIS